MGEKIFDPRTIRNLNVHALLMMIIGETLS